MAWEVFGLDDQIARRQQPQAEEHRIDDVSVVLQVGEQLGQCAGACLAERAGVVVVGGDGQRGVLVQALNRGADGGEGDRRRRSPGGTVWSML